MSVALAISIAVLLALGWATHAVLYAPRRVKPLARFLYKRSAWYRSWYLRQSMRRMSRAFREMQRTIGERLIPTIEKTAQAMREWLEAQPDA